MFFGKQLFYFSLQAILAAKDMEIENYKAAVENMRQQIAGLQIDTDKTSLAMLQQVIQHY